LAKADSQRGQAAIELVAGIPALLIAGCIAFQLLAAGYALTIADGAAEAGALALAEGRPAARASRAALPGWAAERADVRVAGGRVTVRLSPPGVIGALSERLAVSGSAAARPR
jgi:hypothetical protein